MKKMPSRRTPLFEVRHSSIHGYGVFAARRIRKGTAVIEYLGERVSHAEADERYKDKISTDNHTFLFTVDEKTVIDAGVNGNEARFINHGCDPNCESAISNKRVFIVATRTIQSGEELAYDYRIERDSDDAPDIDEIYACRCGAVNCRGSMLEAPTTAPKKAHVPARRAPKRAAGKNGRKRLARRGARSARPQQRGG